jgi:hypothetical protein
VSLSWCSGDVDGKKKSDKEAKKRERKAIPLLRFL